MKPKESKPWEEYLRKQKETEAGGIYSLESQALLSSEHKNQEGIPPIILLLDIDLTSEE